MNSILRKPAAPTPVMSPDGYIRLSLAALTKLSFTHLASGIDPVFLAELEAQTVAAHAAGFSEWASNTKPVISIGWSWFIHKPSGRLLLAPDIVRSNVMLIDIHGYDLGKTATSNLFISWLAVYDWQEIVACQLNETVLSSC